MVIMTDADADDHNPFAYSQLREGTLGWMAPEQVLFRSQRTLLPSDKHNWKKNHKTSIWGIGARMVRLMNCGVKGLKGDDNSPSYVHGKEERPMLVANAPKGIRKSSGTWSCDAVLLTL